MGEQSSIWKMVARIDDPDGPFYTIGQVAEKLGVSRDTVRRWSLKHENMPSHKMSLGDGSKKNAFCWLWTEGDLAVLFKHKQ